MDAESGRIEAILGGSTEATAGFVRDHWGRCHRLAYLVVDDRTAAEDIAQEAMLSALHGLPGFDPARQVEPWLHRIVVNKSRDWLRTSARRREELWAVPAEEGVFATDPEFPDALPDELIRAIRGLGPAYRLVIVLRFVLEYTPTEIAEVLEVPAPTIRTRLRMGLMQLRSALDAGGEETPSELSS